MGLDSVELLIDFENYFNVSISNDEACALTTIQESVDCIGRHLHVVSEKKSVQIKLLNLLDTAFKKFYGKLINVHLSSLVCEYYNPKDVEQKKFVEEIIELEIPLFQVKGRFSNSLLGKLSRPFRWAPTYDWSIVTVEQFIDAICAHNLDRVIDRTHISETYEIYLAVSRLTVNKLGVDYLEVSPEKSFTSDLGID
jgi:acyl carrier protein